jgi:hypothetical protein
MTRDELLHESSVQKMRALRLRNFGGESEQETAGLLFQQAADNELAAFAMIEAPTKLDEIRARSEACGLYFSAEEPTLAHAHWKLLTDDAQKELGMRDEDLCARMSELDRREASARGYVRKLFDEMTPGWKNLFKRAKARDLRVKP